MKPFKLLLTAAIEYSDSNSEEKYPLPNEYPRYDAKPSEGEASVLELLGNWNTCLLPLLTIPLGPRGGVSVRVPYTGQIKLFGAFLNSFVPDFTWLKRIKDRIERQELSPLSNQTCLKKENALSISLSLSIYIYKYI